MEGNDERECDVFSFHILIPSCVTGRVLARAMASPSTFMVGVISGRPVLSMVSWRLLMFPAWLIGFYMTCLSQSQGWQLRCGFLFRGIRHSGLPATITDSQIRACEYLGN